MKKTTAIIVSILFGLGGIFWFLVAREERKSIKLKKEKELRAKQLQNDITRMISIVNGSKPKMVKV